MDKKEREEIRKHIHAAMVEILANPEETENGKPTMLEYIVDRVVAYVSKQMGYNEYGIIYQMLFDHIWEEYGYQKLLLKDDKRENYKELIGN